MCDLMNCCIQHRLVASKKCVTDLVRIDMLHALYGKELVSTRKENYANP